MEAPHGTYGLFEWYSVGTLSSGYEEKEHEYVGDEGIEKVDVSDGVAGRTPSRDEAS